jgi:hypothetical protein
MTLEIDWPGEKRKSRAAGNMGRHPITGQNATGFQVHTILFLWKTIQNGMWWLSHLHRILPGRQLRYNCQCATTQAR